MSVQTLKLLNIKDDVGIKIFIADMKGLTF